MGQITKKTAKTKNGHEVIITTPLPGEGAALLKCVTEIIATSDHLLSTLEEFKYTAELEDEMLKRHFEHPDKVIIVPKINGQIVGMMDFGTGSRKRNSHQGEFGMSVHPSVQGQGIGRLMLESLIEWAMGNFRIETIRLRVHAKNKRAIQLYKSCGFIEEGRELEGVKLGDGDYDDVICMARSLRDQNR